MKAEMTNILDRDIARAKARATVPSKLVSYPSVTPSNQYATLVATPAAQVPKPAPQQPAASSQSQVSSSSVGQAKGTVGPAVGPATCAGLVRGREETLYSV